MESFSQALDKLEATVNRRVQRVKGTEGLDRELSALREDRARLAQELDSAKAKAKKLEDEVSTRLDGAIEDIRSVLEH
jgi:FtsZ-binding cell division protein ZapB